MSTAEDVTYIGKNIAVAKSFVRVQAKATPEVLSNKVTASHYKIGALDAMGKVIEKDKPFHYLDYKGWPKNAVWRVYQRDEDGRFQPVMFGKADHATTEDEALKVAKKLAK